MPEGKDSTVDALDSFTFKDAAGNDTPPAGRGDKRARTTSRTAAPRRASLETRLTEGFGSIGVLVSMFDQHCGTVIVNQAPKLGEAWNEAAQNNPQVRKILEGMMTGGTLGGAVFVTAMTLLPILQHHGLLPFGFGQSSEEIPLNENEENGQSIPVAS